MSLLRPNPAPPSLLRVAALVDERLELLLDAETARWRELDADLVDLLDPLRRLVMAGGKRLRPAFCHWGFVGAGGDPDDPDVIDAGAAFELLQAFALLHDDIMDGSSVRRGMPTAHIAAEQDHLSASWRGESRRFGEGVGILVGDLAYVYADQLVPRSHPDARLVWNELRLELNVGQYLDVIATAQASTDWERTRRIARYKSGKYTIERPLHLGAALAGHFDALAGPLSAYGDPLGEAFQLRDDLLGVFGDQTVTGKPVGDDLREGKPTPLLSAATTRANAAQREVLGLVGDPGLNEAQVAAVQEVYVSTGAVAEIERIIEELTNSAVEAIAEADITEDARTALVDLAYYVAWRDK